MPADSTPPGPTQTGPGPVASPSPGGVIHDIGYRHYDGPRQGGGYIQRSLYVESLKGAYGLGRSARSKIMPILLLVAMSLPALVIGIVSSVIGATELPMAYTAYPNNLQILVSIFLASQAPAVVSRDLRFRVMPLYFSRPLERVGYVHAKLAALATAMFVLLVIPLTILFAGALLAEMPLGDQLPGYLRSLGAAALYAVVLAGIGMLVAALTPRRGFGVAAIIAVLLVVSGVQATVQALAGEVGEESLATYSVLLSPFSLVDGVVGAVLRGDSALPSEPGTPEAVVFTGALLLLVAACYAGLRVRYGRVAVS